MLCKESLYSQDFSLSKMDESSAKTKAMLQINLIANRNFSVWGTCRSTNIKEVFYRLILKV